MSFQDDLEKSKPFEQLVVDLLLSWGIPAGLNPYTDYERLKWFDVWAYSPTTGYWLECKEDKASERTGNIALELEALHHSKSVLFLYGLPYDRKIYIHAFHPWDLERLATATTLTDRGRFYRHRHTQIGDQQDNEGVLIPREIVKTVGLPFGQAIRRLRQRV